MEDELKQSKRAEEKMQDILEDDMLKPVDKEFDKIFEDTWRE